MKMPVIISSLLAVWIMQFDIQGDSGRRVIGQFNKQHYVSKRLCEGDLQNFIFRLQRYGITINKAKCVRK